MSDYNLYKNSGSTNIKKYGVVFKIFDKEKAPLQIHYVLKLSYRGQFDIKHNYIVDREKVYINNMGADLIIEKIAEEAGNCLYPMEIFTDKEGAFQRIINYDAILLRWEKTKEKMSNYYKGEQADRIISSIGKMYSNVKNIENAMKDDLFFSIFFAPIYRVHDKEAKSIYNQDFPLLPFQSPISYSIEQSINKNLTNSGKRILKINGTCNDKRTLNDIKLKRFLPISLSNSEPTVMGAIEFTYKLEAHDNSIFSIVGDIKLGSPKAEYKKIEIEIYHLQDLQDKKPIQKRILPNGKDEEEEYQKYLERKNKKTVIDILLGRKK